MRALALLLVLAPAALASLVSPPPTAWANGCTACECGVAMCIDGAFYWYLVNITSIPHTVTVGEVFDIEARLYFEVRNATEPDPNVTSGPMQLFVTYQYVDPDDGRMLDRSGSAQVLGNATYPGEYSIRFALAEPGSVDIEVWTYGGHSEKHRVQVYAPAAVEAPPPVSTPLPAFAVVVGLAAAALVVRRRRR